MKRHANLLCLGAAVALLNACAPAVNAPEPVFPIPEKKQVDWQKMETYAFVHFGLNTFNDREWGYGDSDPATFNPVKLDCEQWVKTFVAAGMKGVILTAKHHDGFCLWPTGLTEYCIRNTPYKDGKGDIVRDLSEACKKYGIKFAVYLSPWDRHQANYGTPEYVDYFYRQLHELLTNYGPVFEIWFDGANGGDGWYGGAKDSRTIDRKTYYDYARAYEMIDKFQPQAVVFSDGGPGCRWVGNENGFAGATNWSFLRAGEVYPGYPKYRELQYGHADGNQWTAAECDVSIRPGWFYHPEEDDRVKTVEQLTDLYYRSVGHNATLLLNFPVNRDGLIHPTDSANAVDFYKNVQKQLANNLLKGVLPIVSNERGGKYTAKAVTDGEYDTYWATEDSVTSAVIEFEWPVPQKVNRMLLQEYIPLGQRVKAFVVEYLDKDTWLPVKLNEETTTIGYKREMNSTIDGSKIHFEQHIEPLMSRLQVESWRKSVMDVRGWYTYKSEEFYQDDGQKRNTYEAMGQLSGGEKAQLTYTILGSAIAYQFGLTKSGLDSSFRFIAIDEAFRAQDEDKARYLISLCKQLHLQLLVVTPSDNIHIVENDISYVQH